MNKIVGNKHIKNDIYQIEIESDMASKAFSGEFVIIMANDTSERIPLSIYNVNKEKNTVTLVYQVIGYQTEELSKKEDNVFSILGPLGNPSYANRISSDYKHALIIANDLAITPYYLIAKELKNKNIKVTIIHIIDEEILISDLKEVADKLIIRGKKEDLSIINEINYDIAFVSGDYRLVNLMSEYNKLNGIDTYVYLNTLMIDGIGLCGSCRLLMGNDVKFACLDGPEFPARDINFTELEKRNKFYSNIEAYNWLDSKAGDSNE